MCFTSVNVWMGLTYATNVFQHVTSSPQYCFETKIQAKFDKYDQIFKQPEDKLMDFDK